MEENIMTNEVNEIATEAVTNTETCKSGGSTVMAFGVGVVTGFVANKIVRIVMTKATNKIVKKYVEEFEKNTANDAVEDDNQTSDEE